MEHQHRDVKLYNVLFPIRMLLMFPITWAIVLPGNFIIDSLVLIISLLLLKIPDKKQFGKILCCIIYYPHIR